MIALNARLRETGNDSLADTTTEHENIKKVIERECTAFLCRDFPAWQSCVLQHEQMRRLGALTGGIMHYVEGYAAQEEMVKEMFDRYPTPNPTSAALFKRTNWSIRVGGELAWVSFDQYGPRSTDPFVTAGLSHQIRILEKQDGEWKIVMLGHGDRSLEYFDHPVIGIDADLKILWMNDNAREELPNHPALRRSGARLHAVRRADTQTLKAVAAEIDGLNIMEYRPLVSHSRGQHLRPILLESDTQDAEQIVWISKQEDMLFLRFNDAQATQHHLDKAQDLYDLSPAQTRLGLLVLQGLDMPASAQQLGISLNTAKTHLQRLFDKTGARSQAALVGKLLGVTPPSG